MVRLSKPFYLTSPIVSILASVVVGVGAFFLFNGDSSTAWSLFILGGLGLLYAGIVALVLCYKMWEAIQDGHARTTPGKAVGFLFIPLFNCYWIFQVYWGFSKDYNAYIDRHSINARKLQEVLYLVFCILPFTTWIPFLGIVTSIAYYVLFALVIWQVCDAVNALSAVGGLDRDLPPGAVAGPVVPRLEQKLGARPLSLYCLTGEFANESLVVPQDGVSIGRDPSRVNLVMSAPEVSGVHARVLPEPGSSQLWLEDLQSLNGTFYSQRSGQGAGSDWIKLQGKVLLPPGARFRLAVDGPEFEIRAA